MSAVALSPVELVFSDGESAMTDSLKVAKAFNKRHADVIRAVENLESSDDFAKRNFALCLLQFKNGLRLIKIILHGIKRKAVLSLCVLSLIIKFLTSTSRVKMSVLCAIKTATRSK